MCGITAIFNIHEGAEEMRLRWPALEEQGR